MNIKDIAKKIALLEGKKETILKLKSDHNHSYNKETSFTCILDTAQFSDTRKYYEDTIYVDSEIFNNYLDKEVEKIDKDVKILIDKMVKL